MPRKRKTAHSVMKEHVGKKTTDALLKKVQSMAKKKAAPKAIRKAVEKELSKKMHTVLKHVDSIILEGGPDPIVFGGKKRD